MKIKILFFISYFYLSCFGMQDYQGYPFLQPSAPSNNSSSHISDEFLTTYKEIDINAWKMWMTSRHNNLSQSATLNGRTFHYDKERHQLSVNNGISFDCRRLSEIKQDKIELIQIIGAY